MPEPVQFKANVGAVQIHSRSEKGGNVRKSIKLVLDIPYNEKALLACGRLHGEEVAVSMQPNQGELDV